MNGNNITPAWLVLEKQISILTDVEARIQDLRILLAEDWRVRSRNVATYDTLLASNAADRIALVN
jgi:hypothetical protein